MARSGRQRPLGAQLVFSFALGVFALFSLLSGVSGADEIEREEVEASEVIRRFIADSFVLDDDELGPDTSLIDSGIIDSTGVVEIVSFLEEAFDIELDDEDLVAENLDSISRLTKFVDAKRAAVSRT